MPLPRNFPGCGVVVELAIGRGIYMRRPAVGKRCSWRLLAHLSVLGLTVGLSLVRILTQSRPPCHSCAYQPNSPAGTAKQAIEGRGGVFWGF